MKTTTKGLIFVIFTCLNFSLLGQVNLEDKFEKLDYIAYNNAIDNLQYFVRTTYLKIDEQSSALQQEIKDDTPIIFFLIIVGIVILGVVLGLKKKIVVYRDYADVTKNLSLFALPWLLTYIGAFFEEEKHINFINYTIPVIMGVLFIWIIISTYQDNQNIIWTLLALLTKIPLSVIFLVFLWQIISPDKNKSYRERLGNTVKAIGVLYFILRLVHHKVWKYEDYNRRIN